MQRLRTGIILIALIVLGGFLGYQLELKLPYKAPNLAKTYTPETQATSQEIGSYDILGYGVSAAQAAEFQQTEEGKQQLSPENGAIEITEDLVNLGRNTFYLETFGNEIPNTEVVGTLDGPLNILNLSKAILALGGKPTTNLQVPVNQDLIVGGKTFKAGTMLNTGLDVPAGSLLPLGMVTKINQGQIQTGLTCALCHATVDKQGRILEGAPNQDLDSGLLLALASNSAAWFRNTGVDPKQLPQGKISYVNAKGEEFYLPEPKALEDAVDAALLDWAPGNFDSTGDLVENPGQIPSSYTFQAFPYGWTGFANIGWFQGLTTLNDNVHATNSDTSALADVSEFLYGIDKDTYIGILLQNAANPQYRLPAGANPTEFFQKIDPTPNSPMMNEGVVLPNYPQGSLFALDGFMTNSPGKLFAEQNNGMSAWQNTLAPPPYQPTQTEGYLEAVHRGAKVFEQAGCVSCHSGRYLTNHQVIPVREIGTQPARGRGNAKFALNFAPPTTYPPNLSAPIPPDAPILAVPTEISPERSQKLAYAENEPLGGYKVPSLIGLHVTAPYLHDGGVAASEQALQPDAEGYAQVHNPQQLGMAGTLMQGITPDAAASLRVLVDRELRQGAIAANHSNSHLKRSNVEGIGHEYWVDKATGYSAQAQSDLIQFLLSLDDQPEEIPPS